jgi:hypothetical protein
MDIYNLYKNTNEWKGRHSIQRAHTHTRKHTRTRTRTRTQTH